MRPAGASPRLTIQPRIRGEPVYVLYRAFDKRIQPARLASHSKTIWFYGAGLRKRFCPGFFSLDRTPAFKGSSFPACGVFAGCCRQTHRTLQSKSPWRSTECPTRAPNEAAVVEQTVARPQHTAPLDQIMQLSSELAAKARSACQAVRASKKERPGLGLVSEKPGPRSLIAGRACPKFGTQQAHPGRALASPAAGRRKQARRASPPLGSPTARRAERLRALRFPRAPRARLPPWRCA